MTRSVRIVSIVLVSLGSLSLCAAAQAQPGGDAPGVGDMMGAALSMQYGRLLNSPTVKRELNLTDDQEAKIKEAGSKAQSAMREMFSDFRGLDPEEIRAKIKEKMQEMGEKMRTQAEDTRAVIEKTLRPEQLKRLRQIAMQNTGVQALGDKSVQRDLKLSSDQVAKIKAIGDDVMKKLREAFSGGNMQDAASKLKDLGKDAERDAMDVLTEDQLMELEKLKGDKLDIPASELRGPGGFGGGFGGGGFGGPRGKN
jgi:Spy/CpxP family protein refolding chaperone